MSGDFSADRLSATIPRTTDSERAKHVAHEEARNGTR